MQQNGHQNGVFAAGRSINAENPLNDYSATNPCVCYHDLYVYYYTKVSVCWKFEFQSNRSSYSLFYLKNVHSHDECFPMALCVSQL